MQRSGLVGRLGGDEGTRELAQDASPFPNQDRLPHSSVSSVQASVSSEIALEITHITYRSDQSDVRPRFWPALSLEEHAHFVEFIQVQQKFSYRMSSDTAYSMHYEIYISKISQELRHLPIPQLIALITRACNRDRNIVPPYKHLQFTYNAWGQLQFMI